MRQTPLYSKNMKQKARRTKIVATLGPSTDDDAVLEAMIRAGLDCARLNCSHLGKPEIEKQVEQVRRISKKVGKYVAILADIQGPKIRLTGDVAERAVDTGDIVRFSGPTGKQDPMLLEVAYPGFLDLVSNRSEIVIGDGMPRFVVEGYEDGELLAKAITPGLIGPRKGVTVTYTRVQQAPITAKDEVDLETVIGLEVDFIALSFVRAASDVLELRQRMAEKGSKARIIAKIEKIEAFENLDEIITVSDGIMVARGDYGVEAGVARVPLMQKATIARSTDEGLTVITATQMFESMIHAPAPTRAEAADVANAVLDGTSAVMLSGETAVGRYPVIAIEQMDAICRAAEESDNIYCVKHADGATPDEAVMHAAVALGRDTNAAALLVPTTSGRAARTCAKWRPKRPVIALCDDERVLRQLSLDWGVYPYYMPVTDSVDKMIDSALETAKEAVGLETGDSVIISSGPAVGKTGSTNLITLRNV